MNTKIFVLIVVNVMFSGCVYTHGDSKLTIVLKGVLYDKVTETPLDKVSVEFIDTGFDHKLSEHPVPFKVGESDKFGKINLKFDHYWGWNYGPLKGNPKSTFDILLSKDFYKSKRLHFKADDWAEKKGRLYINLEEIYLEPVQ